MRAARILHVGPRAGLAGDGALVMVAACAVLAPIAGVLEGGALPLVAVGLLAPLLAWRLHGRRVDGPSTIGAVFGYMAGVVCALAMLLALAVVGLLLSLLGAPSMTDGSAAGGRVYSGIVVAVFLLLAVWLDVDALRDLLSRREHLWVDVARLLATVVASAYFTGVYVWAARSPDFDYVGAILTIGGCAVVGAAVVTVADLWVRRHELHAGDGHLLTGA